MATVDVAAAAAPDTAAPDNSPPHLEHTTQRSAKKKKKHGIDDSGSSGKRARVAPRLVAVFGLGNSSDSGLHERHSLGARVVRAIIAARGSTVEAVDNCVGAVGVHRFHQGAGTQVLLIPPQGPINGSGPALFGVLAAFDATDAPALVIVDDCSLPIGSLRLRAKGSSGGHRGLESLETSYKHHDYHRLRIGISGKPTKEFVTGAFSKDDEALLQPTLAAAVRAVDAWLSWGPDEAQRIMALVNAPDFVQAAEHHTPASHTIVETTIGAVVDGKAPLDADKGMLANVLVPIRAGTGAESAFQVAQQTCRLPEAHEDVVDARRPD